MYQLEIKNIGKMPKPFVVVDDNGTKRPALFSTIRDAQEAMRIIEMLRSDSAFEWVKVV